MVVVACVGTLMVPCQGALGLVPEGAGDVRLSDLTTSGQFVLSDHSHPHQDALAVQRYIHLGLRFPYLSCQQVLRYRRSNALVAMLAQLLGLGQLARLPSVGATEEYSLALAKVSLVHLYSQHNEESSHEEKDKERFPPG